MKSLSSTVCVDCVKKNPDSNDYDIGPGIKPGTGNKNYCRGTCEIIPPNEQARELNGECFNDASPDRSRTLIFVEEWENKDNDWTVYNQLTIQSQS